MIDPLIRLDRLIHRLRFRFKFYKGIRLTHRLCNYLIAKEPRLTHSPEFRYPLRRTQ